MMVARLYAFAPLILLALQLNVLLISVVGVKSGNYVLETVVSGNKNCPSTATVFSSSSELPATDFLFGQFACNGNEVRFQDIRLTVPAPLRESLRLSHFQRGKVLGMECGIFELLNRTLLHFVQFQKEVGWSDVKKLPGLTGEEEEVGDPPDFTVETGTFYLVSSDSCVWQRSAGVSPSPSAVALPSSPSSEDGGGACFPASGRAMLRNGSAVSMETLCRGDEVHVGGQQHAAVFAWTHRSPHSVHTFVRVHTRLPTPLVLSPSHLVYRSSGRLVAAEDIVVGDALLASDGKPLPVHTVDRVRRRGLYNPQTLHGDIVVDGVHVSTYTTAVAPEAAHALLTPLRAAFKAAASVIGFVAAILHPSSL